MANPLSKIPPHNLDAEKSVLGSILIDKDAIIKIADLIEPIDFYVDANAKIFEIMLELFNEHHPIDLLTVSEKLQDKDILEKIGGKPYLADLTMEVPTSSHIFQYAQIVKQKSTLRKLLKSGNFIIEQGYNEEQDLNDSLGKCEKSLFEVTQTFIKNRFYHIKEILQQRYDEFAELHDNPDKSKIKGVATGFGDLDNLLAGMKPSDLIIIAARPSMGKTSFALNVATNVALKANKTVAVFSLEMSKEQLVDRMFVSLMGVDSWKLKKGQLEDHDFARMGNVMSQLSTANIFLDDTAGSSITEMKSKARRLQMERGLDLIILDYIQMMTGNNPTNRVQEISEISRNLKALARELHVPLIALSQLSRNLENRPNKVPQLADLRESGSIEQDADVVMMIYREDYYEPDTEKKNMAEIHIKKNRNGPTGKIDMKFVKEQMLFRDVEGQREYVG